LTLSVKIHLFHLVHFALVSIALGMTLF
jgi:hypothetical protein